MSRVVIYHEGLVGIHRFVARSAQRAGVVTAVSGSMLCAARRSCVRNTCSFVEERIMGYVGRGVILERTLSRYLVI